MAPLLGSFGPEDRHGQDLGFGNPGDFLRYCYSSGASLKYPGPPSTARGFLVCDLAFVVHI